MRNPPSTWDKADVIFKALVPIVIAVAGWLINSEIAKRSDEAAVQRDRLQRLTLVPSLIDALVSNNDQKRQLAIRTVNALLPVDGPVLLGGLSADPTLPVELRSEVEQEVDSGLSKLVSDLFSTDTSTRLSAFAVLVSGKFNSSTIIELMLQAAQTDPDNRNGIVNVASFLVQADTGDLAKFRERIRAFGDRARQNGPQTAKLIDRIYARM